MAEANDSEQPIQVFSSADRIRQLNEIDKDVAKLVHSAGLAIQALTNARPNDPSSTSPAETSLESHKARFKEATSQYFALLSSIDVRLRRQVYALEEASILAPDSASRAGEGAGSGAGAGAGASNPLDVSWLNSRKDTVGKEKEAELWAAAAEFVQQTQNTRSEDKAMVKVEGGQESMEVD
ncbi:mediator complex protein-domain-containing protein [Aspergillus unguis]